MRISMIRHADPDYERDTITPAGHREAEALAVRLGGTDIRAVYCSPLGRAVDTARYTAERLKLTPIVEPWMAELGDWRADGEDGQPPPVVWNVHGEHIRGQRPFPDSQSWSEWGPYRNGRLQDKFADLIRRSDAWLESLGYAREDGRYRILRPNRDHIAVFAHLGFGLTWMAHLLELPLPLVWAGFWKAPSSVTTILMDERSAEWATPRVIGLGDVSHLHKAGLPVSRQGLIANID